MSTTPADFNTFAATVQTVLASEPPFLGQGVADSSSLGLLTQLLDKRFLNGVDGQTSAWDALQNVVPVGAEPFDLVEYATTRNDGAPSPELSVLLTQLIKSSSVSHNEGRQILDDHSICLSYTFGADGLEPQVTVTPHTLELVQSFHTVVEKKEGWWKLPWSSGEKLKKSPRTVIAKKIWCPPTNAVSILVSWWGYQIFLPHSIMLALGDDVKPYIDAFTKIQNALNFIQTHVPASIAALPGVAQLKAILPIISLICSFIIWTWTTLKNDDKGDGIILAATWILPVALIPRSLDRKKWPAPIVGGSEVKSTDTGPEAATILADASAPEPVVVAPREFVSFEEARAGEGEDPLIEENTLAENEGALPATSDQAGLVANEGEAPGSNLGAIEVAVDVAAGVESSPVEEAPRVHHGIGHIFHFKKKVVGPK